METKNIAISKLVANNGQIEGLPKNPRIIKNERFAKLVKSIEDAPEMLSMRQLIVVQHDKKYIVICGNMRLKACKEIGYKELPCYILPEDTPVEKLREYTIKHSLQEYIASMLKFFIATPDCVKSVAMAQGGDFIGGEKSSFAVAIRLKRKAMNTFICDTERPFQFTGRINEDVNTYTANAHRGEVFLTICPLRMEQEQTQSGGGGMTDVYLNMGTYLKSFFSVMYHPSGVKIATMGFTDPRIHHKVNWNNTAPKILSETWKKTE